MVVLLVVDVAGCLGMHAVRFDKLSPKADFLVSCFHMSEFWVVVLLVALVGKRLIKGLAS